MKLKTKFTTRNRTTALIEDAMGAISLFVLLFVGLGLSGPF